MKIFRAILVTSSILLAACSTMQVSNQWKDPNWSGKPAHSVVVVGIARSDTMRRIFEDTFVQQLQASGLTATPGYTQIKPGQDATPQLNEFVKSSHADVVLATRVQSTQKKVDVSPGFTSYGYGNGFYGWYGAAWMTTPIVSQYEVVTLETTVWDTKSETLIWAATTENVASQNVPNVTTQLAQTLIPRMKAAGILQ